MACKLEPTRMSNQPPRMFSRPTEAPDPLTPIHPSEQMVALHTGWARQEGQRALTESGRGFGARLRDGIRRVWSRDDHERIGDLIRAVDALAVRCDELAERMSHQQIVTSELVEAFGQEITRLRAAVEHAALGDPPQSGA
jgi:hypothetical protein